MARRGAKRSKKKSKTKGGGGGGEKVVLVKNKPPAWVMKGKKRYGRTTDGQGGEIRYKADRSFIQKRM
jgi:hypothetical protein